LPEFANLDTRTATDSDVGIHKSDKYTFGVFAGSGGGKFYAGTKLYPIGDEADDDENTFKGWTGDTEVILDRDARITTGVMPAKNVYITARFINHILTVKYGEGDSDTKDILTIFERKHTIEPKIPEGKDFIEWEIKSGGAEVDLFGKKSPITQAWLDDSSGRLDAMFATKSYKVEVVNGLGSGNYVLDSLVLIKTGKITGKTFHHWDVDKGGIDADLDKYELEEQAFSMPARDVALTAQFVPSDTTYKITVINGEGGESFRLIPQLN